MRNLLFVAASCFLLVVLSSFPSPATYATAITAQEPLECWTKDERPCVACPGQYTQFCDNDPNGITDTCLLSWVQCDPEDPAKKCQKVTTIGGGTGGCWERNGGGGGT